MIHYGQLIDSGFDLQKENVYSLFTQYFEDPEMTKIKDIDKYSMYMTKINALLGIEYRYVIAFINKDNDVINSKQSLRDLKWVSLQTRTLTDEHNLPAHSYFPKRLIELDRKISLVSKDDKQYFYKVEQLPITITLLSKAKSKSNGFDYNSSGTIVVALETYQTIVNFI